MSVLYIVLPLAIILAIAAVGAFAWAVRTGQMDDLQTPALRMLHDDVPLKNRSRSPQSSIPRSSRHNDPLVSTRAETPHARSRASLSDGEPDPEQNLLES